MRMKRKNIQRKKKYKMKDELLVLQVDGQSEDVQFGRILVPNDDNIERKLLSECHVVPYSAHHGVQRTLNKLRENFFWKGQINAVRNFVTRCIICQTEKADYTLSKG